jgi:hypothetical protein
MPTFTHGKAARVLANGYDISSYLKDASMPKSADVAETSALGDGAKTYVAGQADATFKGSGMLDGSTAAIDEQLNTALGADGSEFTYLPAGDALGETGYCMQGAITSYEVNSPVSDVNAISVDAQSSVGAERVVSLAPLLARTGTANLTSSDGAAATTAGGVGYLHATAINGSPTGTVKIQDSADNSTFADIITFAAVTTAHVSERVEVTGTVRRYTRINHAISGGTVTFWAGVGRNPS